MFMYIYSTVGAFDTTKHCCTKIHIGTCATHVYVHNFILFTVYCSTI